MNIDAKDFVLNILAIDVGAGTQDIMLYNDCYESAYKMVLPAPTVILARRIARCTKEKKHIVLLGETMGGGAVNDAIYRHLKTGLKVYATELSAMTVRDDLEQVMKAGVEIISIEDAMMHCRRSNVQGLLTRDVDRDALSMTSSMFNLDLNPKIIAVAIEDHGVARKGQSDRECRFGHFRKVMPAGIESFCFKSPPRHYSRMCGVKRTLDRDFPKTSHLIIDSKIAAVFGCLYSTGTKNGLIADAGNGHTTIAAIENEMIIGLFEHHTHMLNPKKLSSLIRKFCMMKLDDNWVKEDGGHGSFISKEFDSSKITVTGPMRSIFEGTGLNVNYATPAGDIFMTGIVGLIEATKRTCKI